jgi:hypothetical protein
MNKNCEKKTQQHIVKIFYMWMLCLALKERNTKRFVENWHTVKSKSMHGRTPVQSIIYLSITKGLCTLITHIDYFYSCI